MNLPDSCGIKPNFCLVPDGTSPMHTNLGFPEKTPSVAQFRDYANMDEIIRKSQTSKPFGIVKKRTSQDARVESRDANYDPSPKVGKKSLNVNSSLRRKNSQTDSEPFGDLKSDILMQTNGSKFHPRK